MGGGVTKPQQSAADKIRDAENQAEASRVMAGEPKQLGAARGFGYETGGPSDT